MDNIWYYLITYYAYLIKWASIRNHRRNGKFGWYAMGAARNTYLGMDCGLSNHLERTSFFWKGNFSIRCKKLIMLIVIFVWQFSIVYQQFYHYLFTWQIIWFTALFPYFVMSVLLVRSVTLPGASIGLWKVN